MGIKQLSPDEVIYWQSGWVRISATVVFTWVVIGILLLLARGVTRKLTPSQKPSRLQSLCELVVVQIRTQIEQVAARTPDRYIPFIGSLFLFIAFSNFLAVVPGFQPPTGSLSTTAALAICVFVAVPVYAIAEEGFVSYLRKYAHPSFVMIPFNVLGEFSRTLALAVRLFGNVMSGGKIVAILLAVTLPMVFNLLRTGTIGDRIAAIPLTIVPLVFAILLQGLSLLTGLIQAYIFAILATVYIASASEGKSGASAQQPQPVERTNHG